MELLNLISIFIFLVPAWIFLFYKAFMKSFQILSQVLTKPRTHQSESTSLRQCARHTLSWFMPLFCQFQYADFFHLHQIACAQRHFTFTTKQQHDSMKQYVTIIYVVVLLPEIFRLHVPAGSSWTKTTWRTFCSPSSVASIDEVIHSAPWRPWMKSSIVPAALPPVWRPWMKSSIVPQP